MMQIKYIGKDFKHINYGQIFNCSGAHFIEFDDTDGRTIAVPIRTFLKNFQLLSNEEHEENEAKSKATVRILKFEVKKSLMTEIFCKIGSRVIDFQAKDDKYFVWILEGCDDGCMTMYLNIIPTGEEFDSSKWHYEKTIHERAYVWHLLSYCEVFPETKSSQNKLNP